MIRMMTKSNFLDNAQTEASTAPIRSEINVAPTLIPTVILAPYNTRAKMSLPRLSVPNQCSALGSHQTRLSVISRDQFLRHQEIGKDDHKQNDCQNDESYDRRLVSHKTLRHISKQTVPGVVNHLFIRFLLTPHALYLARSFGSINAKKISISTMTIMKIKASRRAQVMTTGTSFALIASSI